jgi:hypothetical protein
MSQRIDWDRVRREQRQKESAPHPEIDHLDIATPFGPDPPQPGSGPVLPDDLRQKKIAKDVSALVDRLAKEGGKAGLKLDELVDYVMRNVGACISEHQVRKRLGLLPIRPWKSPSRPRKHLPVHTPKPAMLAKCPECGAEVQLKVIWKHLMLKHFWAMARIRSWMATIRTQ